MRLMSYGKVIIEKNSLKDIYRYALSNGCHYYSKEYLAVLLENINEIKVDSIFDELKYIYETISLDCVSDKVCTCCGKEHELKQSNIKNIYEAYLCNHCRNNYKTAKEIYYIDFLKNVKDLYELIQFTINNEIVMYTNNRAPKDVIIVETIFGKISVDIKNNMFYIHRNI